MGVFGNLFSKKQKNSEVDDALLIENIIKDFNDKPYATSSRNVIYLGYNELGGYYYLKTMIVGAFNIKTKYGATIVFEAENYTLNLKCDMDEFESNPADIKDRFVTEIDFEIDKKDIDKLKSKGVKCITLTTKKEQIVFLPYIEK